MADSCSELQAQIAALQQAVASIPRIDEASILQKADSNANSLIKQLTPGIVTGIVMLYVNPLNSRIDATANLAKDAIQKYAALASLVASILVTIAALEIAGARIDAVENGLQMLSNDVSNILGSILPGIKAQAERALSLATAAKNAADLALSTAKAAISVASSAAFTAQIAIESAIRATGIAQAAQFTAEIAGMLSKSAISSVESLSRKVNDLSNRIPGIERQVNDLSNRIPGIERQVTDLSNRVPLIERKIPGIEADSQEALREARKANQRALIPGPKGDRGLPGTKGLDGLNGASIIGPQGIPGAIGPRGFPGIGFPGAPGKDGLPGKDGKDGRDGKDGQDVNRQDVNRLESKIDRLPFIIGAATIPKPLTYEQTKKAATEAVCDSTNGGCLSKSLDKQSQNINGNTDQWGQKNFGLNTFQVAQLTKIDSTLGPQLMSNNAPIGLTTVSSNAFLKAAQFFNWAVLGRLLDLLTLAATVHNALMLSNDIGQTLIGIVTNIINLVGIKDSEGKTYNVSDLVSGTAENFLKALIGEENYKNLSDGWAKANRIYQATTNVLNSFLNLSQSILQGAELIAAYTGKIGNALKKGGVVLESAYGWMNPQPKFNRVSQFLERFQATASTIQMVTQAPLDIVNASTELTTASTEFVKAVKEDKDENKSPEVPEPDGVKQKEVDSKKESQPAPFDIFDLFDGED